jgi:hypothetical protein
MKLSKKLKYEIIKDNPFLSNNFELGDIVELIDYGYLIYDSMYFFKIKKIHTNEVGRILTENSEDWKRFLNRQ